MEERTHYIEKVIAIDQLEQASVEGWEVVETLNYDDEVQYTEQIIVPADPSRGITYMQQNQVFKYQIGRCVAFRVRLSADDTVAKFQNELLIARAAVNQPTEEARKFAALFEKEQTEHKKTKDAWTKLSHEIGVSAEACRKYTDRCTQLENDIKKLEDEVMDYNRVKRVIGLRAVSEILLKSDATDTLEKPLPPF
jgi:hypothetical protein